MDRRFGFGSGADENEDEREHEHEHEDTGSTLAPEIRRDEPMPTRTRGRYSSQYGFMDRLGVGESAHFSYDTKEERDKMSRLLSSAAASRKRKEGSTLDFSVFGSMDDDGRWAVGVWRTA